MIFDILNQLVVSYFCPCFLSLFVLFSFSLSLRRSLKSFTKARLSTPKHRQIKITEEILKQESKTAWIDFPRHWYKSYGLINVHKLILSRRSHTGEYNKKAKIRFRITRKSWRNVIIAVCWSWANDSIEFVINLPSLKALVHHLRYIWSIWIHYVYLFNYFIW